MEDNNLTHEDSLKLIHSMISSAKNYYYESGAGALLWGFTNVICFLLAFADSKVEGFKMPFNPFYLMAITFILQFFLDRAERKYKTAETFLDEVNKYVWLAFAISVLLLTIAGGIAGIGYVVLPLLLLLFGIPTFITGCINKFTPFIIGGIFCWVLSAIAFFYKGYNTYLLVAAGATAAWIVPGFILRRRFNKKRNNNHGV
ncbi:MAG: hypothetical protein ABIT07_03545 [Ferruginibacter sp.]